MDVACHDLIYKPKEQGFRTILKEVLRNFFLFFVPHNKAAESLAHKYSGHVLLSSALFASMFVVEGFLFHRVYHIRSPQEEMAFRIVATLVVFLGTVLCCALPEPLMDRGNKQAWLWSAVIQSVIAAFAGLLFGMMVSARPIDTGPLWDWPPLLVIFKALSIFAMFGVVYITNIYNFVLAAEHLVCKRQFHTVRGCLAGDGVALGRLPTTVLYMPFHWAVVAATFVAVFLLILELNAYSQLYDYERVPQNAWIVGMGLLRDAIFIILAFAVLCWYWISLAALKRGLPRPA